MILKILSIVFVLLLPVFVFAANEADLTGEGLSVLKIKCREIKIQDLEKYNIQYADDERIFNLKNEGFKTKGKVYIFGDLEAESGTIGTNFIFERNERGKCTYRIMTYTLGTKGSPAYKKSSAGGGGNKLIKDVVALKSLFAPSQNWINNKYFPNDYKSRNALIEFVNAD